MPVSGGSAQITLMGVDHGREAASRGGGRERVGAGADVCRGRARLGAGHGGTGEAGVRAGHVIAGRAPAPARPRAAAPGIGVTVTKTADPDPYVPGEPRRSLCPRQLTARLLIARSAVPTILRVVVRGRRPRTDRREVHVDLRGKRGQLLRCSGTGDIHDSANITEMATLTYTVKGTVPALARGMLTNVVRVTPAPGETIPVCDPDCEAAASGPRLPVGLTVAKRVARTVRAGRGRRRRGRCSTPGDQTRSARGSMTAARRAGRAGFTWKCRATAGSSCDPSGSGAITTS